jgi:tRNA nucleotidyltransferase/poly(A) polymerase
MRNVSPNMAGDLASPRADPLRVAAGFSRRHRVPVYLVGGAVRDRLLGRAVKDYDFAVPREAEILARHFEDRGFGRAVLISRKASPVPVWRTSQPPVVIDVACFAPEGSLNDDLRRRDFTVNAIALEAATGRFVDPLGGRRDLRRGLLRAVSPENLREDPLRLLRAYRLAATRGLRIEPSTRRAIRRIARRVSRCSPERIHEELARLFAAPRAERALRQAGRDGVLAVALGLSRPIPPGALGGLDRLRPEGPSGDRIADRLAVVFDRCAVSPTRARTLLKKKAFSRAEIREIVDRLEFFRQIRAPRRLDRALFRHRDKLPAFLSLSERAAAGPRERARARRVREDAAALRAGPAPVTGSDVAAWLGLPEGPALGRALERARFLYFRGEADTADAIRARLLRARRD